MRYHTTAAASVYRSYNPETKKFIINLPKPPSGYRFSKKQIEKQKEFFDRQLHTKKRNNKYTTYIGTMIAVLPSTVSKAFREIIHFLFVTHTEAKLNTLGHIFLTPSSFPLHQNLWCANLHRDHRQQT
jgi:hypothetical protein